MPFTSNPTRNALIGARILTRIGEGLTIREAIDAVLGAGIAASIVSDLYDELRANAAGQR